MPESPDDTGRVTPGNDPGHDLERRLEEARQRNRPAASPVTTGSAQDDVMKAGMRSGVEFIAALVVSVGIGIALDRWLNTTPILLLVMLALGFGAGLLNIYRAMNGMGYGQTYKQPPGAPAPGTKDETDET